MRWRTFFEGIFLGNYFYGICAAALSVEASLQQRYPLNDWSFYLLLAAGSIWYYTKAYITDTPGNSQNKRSKWYRTHSVFVRQSQRLLLGLIVFALAWILLRYGNAIKKISSLQLLMTLPFPLLGILYYGVSNAGHRYSLRNIGWMKPFLIGFIWAGLVTVYPIVFAQLSRQIDHGFSPIQLLLFIKNFMFVTVLCIMFDIKDYATDANQQLKTFVVKTGLRHTIFYILIPLCIAGLGCFLLYGFTHGFSGMKIFLNTIPFLLTIAVAYSLHKRKSILYYLVLIDGLMLVKALCGITAMLWF
ncbi:MAG: hypothetical protein JNL13_08075 [Chitinophagaceae bacterium]|nr:hypothetical protein [Chitinophagaceae bacterium]